MTLTEGKYHQVKRMIAAAGNRVETLHRSAFGALVLPADWQAASGDGSTARSARRSSRTSERTLAVTSSA